MLAVEGHLVSAVDVIAVVAHAFSIMLLVFVRAPEDLTLVVAASLGLQLLSQH